MLHQIVYSSAPAQKLMQSHLYMILRHARLSNKLANVTGVLIFVDGAYLQVLEGEENTLRKIFDKIKVDTRHKDVKILSDLSIEKRSFDNWEMAYATPSGREMANWAGLQNTTKIETVLEHLAKNPALASGVFSHLLQSVSSTAQDPSQ
jgi:hypothetical protein